jgi:phosphoribosylaminoimidazole carboxylase PurE protein
MKSSSVQVGILMGSESDAEVMMLCFELLKKFDISAEMHVHSAHRTPEQAIAFVDKARDSGMKIIIAAAGLAAHLAGVSAAHTTLPVIGVPMGGGPLNGMDALLSTVQMPKGTPVGTVGIGKAGAINAALFAVRILALSDQELLKRLEDYQDEMTKEVLAADQRLQDTLP